MEKRLGRGLGSLLGQTHPLDGGTETTELPIDQLHPNPQQPRKAFEPDALSDLADSIRLHGVLQPIAVRPAKSGYELITGERRMRAAQLAGLRSIPAVVRRDVTDEQMLELALVENLQRQDLDAIERARGYQQMIERLQITQEEVARKVGLKRATVTNHLRLLELPIEVQEAVSRGLVSMGHARAMASLENPASAKGLLARVVRDDLSVRQVEEIVRRRSSPDRVTPTAPPPAKTPTWVQSLEDRLRTALGTRVRIRNGPGYRGQILIDYFGREDLERLLECLSPQEKV